MLIVSEKTQHHECFHKYQHWHEEIKGVGDSDDDDEASGDTEEVRKDF